MGRGRQFVAVATVGLAVTVASCGQDASESAGERGEAAYRANCAACHANDLDGGSLGPSLLGPETAALSNLEISALIRNGVEDGAGSFGDEFGAMPGNTVLSTTQVDAIIAYVRLGQGRPAADAAQDD